MHGDVGRDPMGVDPPSQVKSLSLVLKVTGVLNRDVSVIRSMFYSHRSFWQMCAGGAQAKQREDNEECCCFAWVHGLLLSHRADNLFGLVLLMIRLRGAS